MVSVNSKGVFGMIEGACTNPPIKPERPSVLQPVQSPLSWPPPAVPAYDALVAGAGLDGALVARLLAGTAGYKVLVVDPRPSLARVVDEDDRRPAPSLPRRGRDGQRRGAATYLAQFFRCAPCQGSDVPCIHPAQAAGTFVERLLDHPGIDLLLGVEPAQARGAYGHERFVEIAPDAAGNQESVARAIAAFERIAAGGSPVGSQAGGEEAIASAA
jgi:choline dehydrogenase-like flavoprotein